jgi:hypothetical protein
LNQNSANAIASTFVNKIPKELAKPSQFCRIRQFAIPKKYFLFLLLCENKLDECGGINAQFVTMHHTA